MYEPSDIRTVLRQSLTNNGHANSRHELIGDGYATAPHIRLADMRKRILGGGPNVSSFRNCLPDAIAFALRKGSGQRALTVLAKPETIYVFACVSIKDGGFRMVRYSKHDLVLNADGKDFMPESGSRLSFARPEIEIADVLAIKLMVTPDDDLHIRTAFPIRSGEKILGIEARDKDGTEHFYPE
ncbi:hypothetical protein EJV46_21945 [Roseococcus sp. SYP-B2431]|uniref:hypothetical protein n=1 Tax=Roseococcus sp. SYP-B2431 TaxID=2496640 RepID=UPI00103EF54C|nr:hypothetical protein [Roseococcus sp. SYP-B2431]TCH95944.1 hypothetical protein EJV46_21945 [Roseococcus sp. SYP-B2431]